MKLSEAIRLGAMVNGQGFGQFIYVNPAGEARTCAIGAAIVAAGGDASSEGADETYGRFPILNDRAIDPARHRERNIAAIVMDLNDVEKWTREDIAAWVETLEPRDLKAPQSQPDLIAAASAR